MTPRQQEIVEAVARYGGRAQAARALGINVATVRKILRAAGAAGKHAVRKASSKREESEAKRLLIAVRRENATLRKKLAASERVIANIGKAKAPPKIAVRRGRPSKHGVRVIIPDSHGAHIDNAAASAMLRDLELLGDVDEIICLGDHLDCGGTFSSHQRNYTHEMTESYASDVAAANWFFDEIRTRAPNAVIDYIAGNHEQHIERWAARNFDAFADAQFALERLGPEAVLHLKKRQIRYYRQSEMYDGLSVPGTIKRGKCYFTHGMSHAKHADAAHLQRVGANVVFGHVHRVMSVGERTVECDAFGAWCPGTLAKLQPLYKHTVPSSWQHGYAVQFINKSTGTFVHFNVPIYRGESYLRNVVDGIRK